MDEGLQPIIPSGSSKSRNLRACLLCALVMTGQDFKRMGCPNCDNVLEMKGSSDRVNSCTSIYWEGTIAVMEPETSWVAKWQRTRDYHRGVYAARVKGRLPEEIEDIITQKGFTYRPRDGTAEDD
ncbi:transcription initiation protein spt4 [Cylindrobasidium torrendii FP15055 ss-10]|uniref:Transcription elongation factor SPT4 n=1 Tax=Cylindrobasidium torrendii FP15055 ss-10 TaxID=1314674 RepID=A0A0D7BSH7_9AGAR|nr:transcription initiation protein spt4 [Cylindrobasidium torrendii FP15055 ss-10]